MNFYNSEAMKKSKKVGRKMFKSLKWERSKCEKSANIAERMISNSITKK